MKKIVLLNLVLSLFTINQINGQMTINAGATAASLATSIKGNGITITNPVKFSPNAYTGTFSNGNKTNIGITSGIILSTGVAAAINGVASNNANTNSSGAGYSLLDPLAGAPTFDASRIELDVVPNSSTLQMNYVFGGEEYPDYVGTPYNDAFGFFLSGPNPSGGNYVNENFAVLPSTNIPISVNTVNDGYLNSGPCMNCSYYIDNSTGTSIKYNGFTTPITSTIKVTPGASYHLVIAIADGNDGNQDAALLISLNGLDSPISLPVDFQTVSGEQTGAGNMIKWSTQIELNLQKYIVQRSFDGYTYEDVGIVYPDNNNGKVHNYHYFDKSLSSATYSDFYYRIKLVDLDGQVDYGTQIIHIKNKTNLSQEQEVVSTMISSNKLLLKYNFAEEGDVEVIISDASGNKIIDLSQETLQGLHEIEIPMNEIKDGLYFIKLITSTETKSFKIYKI
jgi:hypothetical protein